MAGLDQNYQTAVSNGASTFIEERYKLICCSTGEALKLNGLTAVFVYEGFNLPNTHPDDLIEVVITAFKTTNGVVITGCYKLLEEECKEEEWTEFKWLDTFTEITCVNDCFECLPEPVIVKSLIKQKVLYPNFIVNNVDPDKAESIFCTYADMNYKKVLALRYGIEFCCPFDLVSATIDFEILKMDIATDSKACCVINIPETSCADYTVTLIDPLLIDFNFFSTQIFWQVAYNDCNNEINWYDITDSGPYVLCGVAGQNTNTIYLRAIDYNYSESVIQNFTTNYTFVETTTTFCI